MSFVCPNAMVLCKIKDCSRCQHADDMSACPTSHSTGGDDLTPTFSWALDMVANSKDASLAHRRGVVNSVRADIRLVGLDDGCKLNMMTRGKFKILINLLEARGLSKISVREHLNMFSSLCCEKREEIYERDGYELPVFNIPAYHAKVPPVQEVPERNIAKFKKLMGKWALEGNTQLYIAAWFGINCGMRWGDLCRIKWDVFVHTVDGVFVSYVPHKTERTSSAKVSFRVDPEAYLDIEPYIGLRDNYVIIRHEGRCKDGQKKHGEYACMHRSLHNRINSALKECGIGVESSKQKKFHALRKRFDTRNSSRFGDDIAAKMSGHSVAVAKKSYIGTESGRWS